MRSGYGRPLPLGASVSCICETRHSASTIPQGAPSWLVSQEGWHVARTGCSSLRTLQLHYPNGGQRCGVTEARSHSNSGKWERGASLDWGGGVCAGGPGTMKMDGRLCN